MAGVNNGRAAARRERVGELWTKGASAAQIARVVGADRQTVRRDLALLGRELVAETDLPAQLARLLRGAQAVEVAAWGERQLGLVLASLKTQATVLAALQGLDVTERVEALERRLDELGAGATLPVGSLNGHAGGTGRWP